MDFSATGCSLIDSSLTDSSLDSSNCTWPDLYNMPSQNVLPIQFNASLPSLFKYISYLLFGID